MLRLDRRTSDMLVQTLNRQMMRHRRVTSLNSVNIQWRYCSWGRTRDPGSCGSPQLWLLAVQSRTHAPPTWLGSAFKRVGSRSFEYTVLPLLLMTLLFKYHLCIHALEVHSWRCQRGTLNYLPDGRFEIRIQSRYLGDASQTEGPIKNRRRVSRWCCFSTVTGSWAFNL